MNKEFLEFTVHDAINPYAEALKEAGLPIDHSECKEKKEIAIDMEEVVEEHIQHYKDQKMPTWAEDIEQNKEELLDILLDEKEKDKIEKRIKEGMIPIVMPGSETQRMTWLQPLKNLKPIWIENGEVQTLYETYIFQEGYNAKIQLSLDPLPDRPYLVWVKPTAKVHPETTNKIFKDQQTLLKQLNKDNPDLVDTIDILPTEYAALQSKHTREIQKLMTEHKNPDNPTVTIHPLDYYIMGQCPIIRFLSTGLFPDGRTSNAGFFRDWAQMSFDWDSARASTDRGFRPVARS